jgi:hypothetical protein
MVAARPTAHTMGHPVSAALRGRALEHLPALSLIRMLDD